jgi:hypothetical protein
MPQYQVTRTLYPFLSEYYEGDASIVTEFLVPCLEASKIPSAEAVFLNSVFQCILYAPEFHIGQEQKNGALGKR